jgi:hypothetical protein
MIAFRGCVGQTEAIINTLQIFFSKLEEKDFSLDGRIILK